MRLLKRAEEAAIEAGKPALSLIVADSNTGARRLYSREGYEEIAKRPVIAEDWETEAQNWVLMIRSLGS